jgi:hypothetical protein
MIAGPAWWMALLAAYACAKDCDDLVQISAAVTYVDAPRNRIINQADHPVFCSGQPAPTGDDDGVSVAHVPRMGDTVAGVHKFSDMEIATAGEGAGFRSGPHKSVLQALILNEVEEHRKDIDISATIESG